MANEVKVSKQSLSVTPSAIEARVDEGAITIGGVQITGWRVVVVTGPTTVNAVIGDRLDITTTGGAVTVNLPAVPSSASVRDVDVIIKHIAGNLATNPVTVHPATGDEIDDSTADKVYNNTVATTGFAASFCHDGNGTDWRTV